MIVRARTVVTMNGPTIANGAVVTSGDRIAAVGPFDQIKRSASGETIDLGERILLPGLINAHCHLDYTLLRGRIRSTKSFSEWVRTINAAKQNLSPEDYIDSINAGISESRKFGTTSIVNLEAFPKLVSRIASPLRVLWLGELIDVRDPESTEGLVEATVRELQHTEHWGLAPHSPFTASRQLYRRCQNIAERDHVLLSTHIAESRDEMQMFREGSGPLHQFLQSVGRDMADCGKQSPVVCFLQLFAEDGTNTTNGNFSNWIVAHLNELDASDIEMLARIELKFHIAHCPRSHQYFGHNPFAFEKLRRLGYNICIGTDSLASNDDLSMFAEMRCFRRAHPEISAVDVLELVTLNPARAVGLGTVLGRVTENAFADLIAIDHTDKCDVFETIIAHDRPVSWVMLSGTPMPA